jgi:hypothetical protein
MSRNIWICPMLTLIGNYLLPMVFPAFGNLYPSEERNRNHDHTT